MFIIKRCNFLEIKMLRLLLSILIGYILGYERKKNDKCGGSRTMALICLASCLLSLLSLEFVKAGFIFDFVRMFSYSIAGIGFLGSAVICHKGKSVEGITTAGLIWVSVPIGFCIGLGYYFYGIISSILVYLILESKYWRLKKQRRR
jgi:putative Mg2+ transporter-C (MgtC) family protein